MTSPQPLTIAIAGLGTVGAGLMRLLTENTELIERRAGRPIRIVAVSARDRSRNRGVDLGPIAWFGDAVVMAREASAEVFVELIGGAEGIARECVEAAIQSGRTVVTANKALLAHHGTALVRLAEAKGVTLSYEAAVAGGIPVIKTIKEGLAGNRISGPALIEEHASTTVLMPGDGCEVDAYGNLVIAVGVAQ